MKNNGDTEQIIADFAITLDILGTFKITPQIPFNNIDVITKNGCVTLEGSINRNYQKKITSGIVENVQGVKKLENKIAVNRFAKDILFSSYSAN